MSLLAYGLVALAILGAIGGLYGTVHHSGVEEGRAEVTKNWEAQNAKNREIVLGDRTRQEGVRNSADKKATRRLTDARKRTSEVVASLHQQIQAAKLSPDCRIDGVLLNTVNRSLTGEGVGTGTVPSKPGTAAPAR